MKKNKHFTKAFCTVLSILLLLSSLPFTLLSFAEEIKTYNVGDKIQFGAYPQTKVTDTDLIAALNACEGEWVSYGYYSGTGTDWSTSVGVMQQGDYMKYKDIIYNNDRYRAVTFSTYRPYFTGCSGSSSSYTYQLNYYYTIKKTYWFKYEPITWRVLDPETGLILCENIIDSQAFSDTVYKNGTDENGDAYWKDKAYTIKANVYAESTIRQWLNEKFFNTAFNLLEQQSIYTTALENKAFSSDYNEYDSADTNDKVFLLTYADVQNAAFGFSSVSSRKTNASEYAKSQGVQGNTIGFVWRLRSAGIKSVSACEVSVDGTFINGNSVCNTSHGIRPAMRINLSTFLSQSPECIHAYTSVVTPPTCTTKGYTTHTCSKCQNSYVDTYVDMVDHTPGAAVVESTTPVTCSQDMQYDLAVYCTVCKQELSRQKNIIDPAIHDYQMTYVAPTCLTDGSMTLTCTKCELEVVEVISAIGHNYVDFVVNPTCTEDGYTRHCCKNCKNEYTDTPVNALQHSMQMQTITPTCTENGCDVHICSRCGYNYFDNEIKALGHSLRTTVMSAPTCTTQGVNETTCIRCDYLSTDTQAALGHKASDWLVAEQSTCTDKGLQIRQCETCKAVLDTNEIAATGHRDSDSDGYCNVCGAQIASNCEHMCHKGGFFGFIWNVINVFNRLFQANQYCTCGARHW